MIIFFEQGLILMSVLLIWFIQFLTFKYIDKIPSSIGRRVIHIGIIPMLLSVIYIYGNILGFSMMSNLFFWCALMLNLYKACRISLHAALMSSGIISFNLIIIKNIVVASIAIYHNKGIKEIVFSGNEIKIVFICCLLSAILFFIGNIVDPNSSKDTKVDEQYSRSKVVLIGIVLFNIYLLFCIFVAEYGVIVKEAVIFYLISILWLLFMGLVLLAYEGQNAKNREQKENLDRFNEQLKRQLQYYQSYKDYTESLNDFKYDYKKMMASVTELMSTGHMEEARQLVLSINDALHKKVEVHKAYSNSILMDALLQDVANRCKAQGTPFEAKLYIPENIKVDEKVVCHIFTILCEDAIKNSDTDAIEKQKMTIMSKVKGNWLNISISYNEGKKQSFDLLNEEIQKNGGILNTETDEDNKTQQVFIHLPISKNNILK